MVIVKLAGLNQSLSVDLYYPWGPDRLIGLRFGSRKNLSDTLHTKSEQKGLRKVKTSDSQTLHGYIVVLQMPESVLNPCIFRDYATPGNPLDANHRDF
jgi:hypothetical protein